MPRAAGKPAIVTQRTAPESLSPAGWLAWWALAFALVGSGCIVDPSAEAAFDAPQRLAMVLGAAIGGVGLLWHARFDGISRWSAAARAIAVLAGLLLAWLALASAMSTLPNASFHTLRTLALASLLLPLGASDVLDGRAGRRLLVVAAFVIALNGLLSLLQMAGATLPLPVARIGGRLPTGALLGNEGYVALACALLGAGSAAVAVRTPRRGARGAAICVVLGCIAVIALNRQVTAAAALAAGVAVVIAVRWRLRGVVGAGALLLGVGVLAAAVAPLRAVTWGAVADLPTWQSLTTQRVSAWATALAMAQENPVTGVGPGRFAAQGQTQRFALEIALRERLPPPSTATGFAQAHNDWLQLAAEAGWPGLLLALAAFGLLLTRLLALAREHTDAESLLLLALLTTGAVAALAWFPMQIPLTATVLLLACGRAWRRVARTPGAPT